MRFFLYIVFLQVIVFSLLPDLLIADSVLSDSLLSGDRGFPKKEAIHLVDKGIALNDNSEQEADYYKRAIQISPDYSKAHFNLGFVFHSQGMLEQAIAAYRQCVHYDPSNADAHYNLADCLLAVRRDTGLYEVRHHLNKAIELQERLATKDQTANPEEQKNRLLEIEQRINKVLKPVVAESYSTKEMITILNRRIKRGGQTLYQGPRLTMLCFQTGSIKLTEKGEILLQTLARALKSQELVSYRFIIEGHADGRGSAKQNLALSKGRAKTVQDWLIKQGDVEEGRLKTVFFGEDHPIYPNNYLKNYNYNRRVEIIRR